MITPPQSRLALDSNIVTIKPAGWEQAKTPMVSHTNFYVGPVPKFLTQCHERGTRNRFTSFECFHLSYDLSVKTTRSLRKSSYDFVTYVFKKTFFGSEAFLDFVVFVVF